MSPSSRAQPLAARLFVASAVASVVLVALTAGAMLLPQARQFLGKGAPSSSYAVGDRLDVDPALFEGARATVFLFARASCGACQASKPLMASIVSDLAAAPDVNVMMLAPLKEMDANTDFGRDLGLAQVVHSDIRQLRLRYVPSVVVTDGGGTVLWSHEGMLTEDSRVQAREVALSATGR